MAAQTVSGKLGSWQTVAVLTFVLYVFTASPAMGWLDSPEFVASAASLGVAHSPGHPLPSFLGRLVAFLPFGDIAFRINLSSALCGVLAAIGVWFAIREALFSIENGHARAIATAGALLFAFSAPMWNEAVRAEVYALQTALLAGATFAVLRYDRTSEARWLLFASLCTGLSLANHHFLAVLFFVPAAIFIFARRKRPGLSLSVTTAALGVIGLLAFLYLPVRSLKHPMVNWAAPHTLDRFLWTISGRAFMKSTTEEHVSPFAEDVAQACANIFDSLSWPVVALALLGFYLAIRLHRRAGVAIWLSASGVLVVLARAWIGFDPDTPDHQQYLAGAYLPVVILAAMGFGVILDRIQNRAFLYAMHAVLVLAVVFQVGRNLCDANLSDEYGSEIVAQWELDSIPPKALVLLAYNQTSFRVQAKRALEDARPDVTFLDRSFLTYPGMAELAKHEHPELATLIDAPLAAGNPLPVPLLSQIALSRPVLVQLHPNLHPQAFRLLAPVGAFAYFQKPLAVDADVARRVDLENQLRVRQGDSVPFERANTYETLLWFDSMAATFYCGIGQYEAGQARIALAQKLFPDDETLTALAATCH